MANTVIALKKSATASAVPADLANGELAINYADGKLYYKHANGAIAVFSSGSDSFGTVNANSTLVIADTSGDILTLVPGNNISIVGNAINDTITIGLKDSPIFYGETKVTGGGKFIVDAIGGDEGGEILLEKPPNGNLDGGITIDAYQNKLRIFEQGGSARGVYIDLTAAAAGVATDLLNPSAIPDATARSWAAAAFAKANTANTTADLAFDKANAANLLAFNTGIGANAYATSVGTAGNAYAVTVGTAGNNYTITVGAAANGWANTISSERAAAANGWANTISDSRSTASNAYATSVGTAGNNYTITVGAAANGWANTVGADAKNYSNSTFVKLSAASQTITGNLDIVGTLTLSGNTVFIDATNLLIDDPLIYLAGNNFTSDIVDIGFIANYVNATGSNVHTGLYREHEDKMYYLFQGYDKEPANNHIGAFSNNMTLAVLNADLKTSNLSLGGVNAITWITSSFNKANAALPNTSGSTFAGVLNVSDNVTTQGLNVTSNVISFGSAMSILPNGMIMIYGDINMLT